MAERLTAEFGNGFSLSNLKLMRQFYMQYAQRIGQTASGFSDGQAPSAISQTLSDLLVAGNGNAPSPSAGPIRICGCSYQNCSIFCLVDDTLRCALQMHWHIHALVQHAHHLHPIAGLAPEKYRVRTK